MLNIPIFYYHKVQPVSQAERGVSIIVPPERFARQMAMFRRLGYSTLSTTDFLDCLEKDQRPAVRCLMITFDDGHADNLIHAAPILAANGFKATIFVVAGYIGRRIKLRSTTDPSGDPILSREQILEWLKMGMEIQSHGMTHANLADMKDEEVRREMAESKQILEDLIQKPVSSFCYPFGSFRAHHLNIARAAGYRAAFSTIRGKHHQWRERFALKRIPVHAHRGLMGLLGQLYVKSYRKAQARLDQILTKAGQ